MNKHLGKGELFCKGRARMWARARAEEEEVWNPSKDAVLAEGEPWRSGCCKIESIEWD